MKIHNIKGLADYLDVTIPTVRNWMDQGLPVGYEGLTYVFTLREVTKWLKEKSPRHAALAKQAVEKSGRA